MRVLLVTNVRPVPGGVGAYVDDLASGLSSSGHHAQVLSFFGVRDGFPVVPRNLTGAFALAFDNDLVVMLLYHLTKLVLRERARRLLAAQRFDVIHCQDVSAFDAVYPLTRHTPVFLTIHGRLGETGIDTSHRSSAWLKRVFERDERTAFSRAALVFVLADPAMEYVRSKAPEARVVRTEALIDLAKWQAGLPFGLGPERMPRRPERAGGACGTHLLAVSRLVSRKGIDHAIRAMALLPDSACLTVAGSGPELPGLKKLVREMGLLHRVTFTGHIDHNQVSKLYLAADIVLVPSVTYEGVAEQAPVSILEALASGTPVVASGAEGLARLVEEAGILVPEQAPEAIAQAVKMLATDQELYRQLAHRGLEAVRERHDAPAVARRLVEAYTSVR